MREMYVYRDVSDGLGQLHANGDALVDCRFVTPLLYPQKLFFLDLFGDFVPYFVMYFEGEGDKSVDGCRESSRTIKYTFFFRSYRRPEATEALSI